MGNCRTKNKVKLSKNVVWSIKISIILQPKSNFIIANSFAIPNKLNKR